MCRRIVSFHLKTLAASDLAAASPRRLFVCKPVLSAISSSYSSDFLSHISSETECRLSPYEHIKTLAAADFAAASASPRRLVICKPVGLHLALNRPAIYASSSVFLPRNFSSEPETPVKKNEREEHENGDHGAKGWVDLAVALAMTLLAMAVLATISLVLGPLPFLIFAGLLILQFVLSMAMPILVLLFVLMFLSDET